MRKRRRRRKKKWGHLAKKGGQRLAAELRGQDLTRVLIVPIDSGKRSHKALVANALGEIVVEPFRFDNDLAGATLFDNQIRTAAKQANAVKVLIGIEPTGHYTENLVAHLLDKQYEIRQVNPLAVKHEREAGLTWCKTDELDLCAIGQLLLNGRGQPAEQVRALYYNLRQAARARRSSVKRVATVRRQIHAYMDRLFPGLLTAEVLSGPFRPTTLAFIRHYGGAHGAMRAGVGRLSRWLSSRRRVSEPHDRAVALVELARGALLRPAAAEDVLLQAVRARIEEYDRLDAEIRSWEARLAEYLIETPGIWLLAIHEVSVISAAEYQGELGPLSLYQGPSQIIGRAGLVPINKQSSEWNWQAGITKLGHPKLRNALGIIAQNLTRDNSYFLAFHHRLTGEAGKDDRLATTAVACKFVRVGWAMMRFKAAFVPPMWCGDHLGKDIAHKCQEFLQGIGMSKAHRTRIRMRLRQVLEAAGYYNRQPTSSRPKQTTNTAGPSASPPRGGDPKALADVLSGLVGRLNTATVQEAPTT